MERIGPSHLEKMICFSDWLSRAHLRWTDEYTRRSLWRISNRSALFTLFSSLVFLILRRWTCINSLLVSEIRNCYSATLFIIKLSFFEFCLRSRIVPINDYFLNLFSEIEKLRVAVDDFENFEANSLENAIDKPFELICPLCLRWV